MAHEAKKTEHSRSKKGTGAYWGSKKDAKHESNKKRREDGKALAGSEFMDEIDSYSYHEALDRAYIQLNNLENTLGDHPVILAEKEAKALYDKAVNSLSKLHQKLGTISLEK